MPPYSSIVPPYSSIASIRPQCARPRCFCAACNVRPCPVRASAVRATFGCAVLVQANDNCVVRARPLPMPAHVALRSTATFVVLVASSPTASTRAHCAALSPACTRRPAPLHAACILIGVIKLSELAGPEPTCEQGSLRLRSSRIMSSPIGTTRMCLRLATYILIPDRHQASPHRLLLHLLPSLLQVRTCT